MTVLDASALLALVRQEPGGQRIEDLLTTSHVGAVNASEFIQKLNQYGAQGEVAFGTLESLGLKLQPVTREDAIRAASFYSATRRVGLSMADRMCLALAHRLGVPAHTADAAWKGVAPALGVKVVLLR